MKINKSYIIRHDSEIMSNEKYFNLCNDLCKKLIDKYGYKSPITNYPKKISCIVLVWTAVGKIENGGFNYLFGAAFPGDPNYEYTLNSFKEIECHTAYEAVKKAICLFPNCIPPSNDHERILQYKQHSEKIRDDIDNLFWSALDQITICLANYIIKEGISVLE